MTQENLENKLVSEIQKIKKVDTTINKETTKNNNITNNQDSKKEENNDISKMDIQSIKKLLMEEYEVSEKCLKIN